MDTWAYSLINQSLHDLFSGLIIFLGVFKLVSLASLPHLDPQSTTISHEPSLTFGSKNDHHDPALATVSIHCPTRCTHWPKNITDTSLLEDCLSRPLSPELWKELKLNEFLLEYPDGDHLSLTVGFTLSSDTKR